MKTRNAPKPLPRSTTALVFLVLAGLAGPGRALAQTAELDSLASRIVERIERKNRNLVLVADFTGPEAKLTELGRDLASQFSAALARANKNLQLLPRDNLVATWDSALDIDRDTELREGKAARALARIVNAQVVITGTLALDGGNLELRVKVWNIPAAYGRAEVWDPEKLGEAGAKIPLTESLSALLAKPLVPPAPGMARLTAGFRSSPPPKPRPEASQAETLGPSGETIYVPGRNGVGYPSCIACPIPEPSDEARRLRVEGTVRLRVIITAEGRTENVQVLSSPGYGFDERAVEAVRAWRFKPATGPNGKPVPVRTVVEVSFRFR